MNVAAFIAIPAIDVRAGRVVRLLQGDYAAQTIYAGSPLEVATRYREAGAQWLHLVDLDAARSGGYTLQPLLEAIVRNTGLKVQTGGGVRTEVDVEGLFGHGAARVVVGTTAVREPARVIGWLERYGSDRITLALDTRQDANGAWQLPVAGWTSNSNETLEGLLQRYADAGLCHLLCTDIARDGMLSGFNLGLYGMLCARWPALHVQASGGVNGIGDVAAARDAGASGAILGRALLEGRFTLAEALAC